MFSDCMRYLASTVRNANYELGRMRKELTADRFNAD
jgi:hypothetical protein